VLRLLDSDRREIIVFKPERASKSDVPPPATEPPLPGKVNSADELFIIGLHLEQYRHATRCPTLYWREALRRDPFDARCNNALGLWHLRRGELPQAEHHFRKAVVRLTSRNANPYDGVAYYNLGLCLRYQLDSAVSTGNPSTLFDQAHAAFYKATWNQAWRSAAFHALAELDCRRSEWSTALDNLERSLRLNADNLRARNLKALVLRQLSRSQEAERIVTETLELDPLDMWSQHLSGKELTCDLQTGWTSCTIVRTPVCRRN
jgi:tetratricopeptide (TPR) repeat protein